MASMPIREAWTGRIVEGKFRLTRWLGGSEGCGVFLTERQGGAGEKAVLKLMPVEAANAENRAAGWEVARELAHPHLLRVYAHGHDEMGGTEFAYVVTEYAPEVLAEVLPERALSVEETRAALEPLVDALEYLHGRGLVHGHVKPSNILADGDELKLTIDHLLRVGEVHEGFAAGAYDAPELRRGVVTPAADVWSLGVTLVEMLTQKRPEETAEGEPVLPEGLPEPFAWIARESLRVDPAQRCGLKEIRARLRPEAERKATARADAAAAVAPKQARPEPKQRPARPPAGQVGMELWMKLLLAAVAVVVVALGLRMWMTHGTNSEAPVKAAPAQPVRPAPTEPAPAKPAAPPVTVKGAIAERVPPEVLQSALATIHGTLVVEVQVTVGPNGRVTDATFADHGPSQYFAKASMKAAQQWRFRPAEMNGRRVNSQWLLRFAYTTAGDEVTAQEVSP